MENIWTKINNDTPQYMKLICENYNLFCMKISPLKTALVGKNYALIIAIDRFDVDVSYWNRRDGKNELYFCNNFFAEKYNAEDRKNLLEGNGSEIIVRNNLIVIASGLASKWSNVLAGDLNWLDDYKNSRWYESGKLTLEEESILKMHCL